METTFAPQALDAGCSGSFEIPGFVPEYIRPLFCEGKGRFAGSRSREIQVTFARQTIGIGVIPEDKRLIVGCGSHRDRVQF